jgi:hypothetical protein
MILSYKDKAISVKKLSKLNLTDVYAYFGDDTFKFLIEAICLLTSKSVLPHRKTVNIGVVEARELTSNLTQISRLNKLLKETVVYIRQFHNAKKGKQVDRNVKFIFTSWDLECHNPPRYIRYEQ